MNRETPETVEKLRAIKTKIVDLLKECEDLVLDDGASDDEMYNVTDSLGDANGYMQSLIDTASEEAEHLE